MPEPVLRDEAPSARIEREAAEWFFQRDRGLAPDDSLAFAGWLESPAHRAAFSEIERTWGRLAELPGSAAMPRRRAVRWVAMAVGLAAAAVVALVLWRAPASFHEQAATEVGGLRKLDLPDGSFVTLNTNSSVDVQFMATERRVRLLRGEAHFEVAKNPARPFVVEATGVAVQAVGTAFNVRLKETAVEVFVTEGRVRVDDAARGATLLQPADAARVPTAPLLHAGERVTISVGASAAPQPAVVTVIAAPEIVQALAWRQRRLDYADAPLSEIVADFNRYNQHRLVIADATLANRHFGGSFAAGDYVSLVQLLEKTFGVSAEHRERETVLRLP